MTYYVINNASWNEEFQVDQNIFKLLAQDNSKILIFSTVEDLDFIQDEVNGAFGQNAALVTFGNDCPFAHFSCPKEVEAVMGPSVFLEVLQKFVC